MMNEIEELHSLAQGRDAALASFMTRHTPRLYYYVLGILGNKEMAEEVVSDVFVEVWKSRRGILDIKSIPSWLSTIAYNKAISCLRKEQRHQGQVSVEDIPGFQFPVMTSPHDDLVSQEQIDRLNDAIGQLPPKCRHVFWLAKIEGKPYAEITQTLGISLATVNYHVGYAMNFLKKTLRMALFFILTYIFC